MSDGHPAPYQFFRAAQDQFDRVATFLGLDESLRELLRWPLREHRFAVPVAMDDGRTRVFRGFRVQHNDARGPAKGGIRFHPQESLDAARAQAMGMSWKSAIVDIPLGGSHGGVACDPHNLSATELQRLCRGWVRALFRELGPRIDVAAPDIMTGAPHMLWMLDEYETMAGRRDPGFITGKPVALGGSLGRTEAAGYGLVFVLREALAELGQPIRGVAASVQGFGNVAQHAIELLTQVGGKVLAVSCWDQAAGEAVCFRREQGVDLAVLRGVADRFGSIDRNAARDQGYEVLPGAAWLEQPVDVLIPAAIENQLTAENVARVHPAVRFVLEGADAPTSAEAGTVLAERGVTVIPDALANSGGVTCSYFEQVQSNANFYWEKDEVLARLDTRMTTAAHAVFATARRDRLPLREAALVIAVARVAEACRERGWA